MAYPVAVPKVTVNFGPAIHLESGAQLDMDVEVRATRSVVWLATGQPMVSALRSFSSQDGLEYSLDLPASNSEGYGDGQGNAIEVGPDQHAFAYRAKITYKTTGTSKRVLSSVDIGPFVLPEGSGPTDLDTMLTVTGTGGVAIAVPDTWSNQIAAAQQAALDAAAALDDLDPTTAALVADDGSALRNALVALVSDEVEIDGGAP